MGSASEFGDAVVIICGGSVLEMMVRVKIMVVQVLQDMPKIRDNMCRRKVVVS